MGHFLALETDRELVIEINTACNVEVSFIVQFELSSMSVDCFGNFAKQLFAYGRREHPNVRTRTQEICVA